MLRTILCVALALFVSADVALAKGKKGDKGLKPVIGTVKAADAKAGTVTVTVTSKKAGTSDKDFTVADTTTITITNADGTTKELKGKDGLKDAVVVAGATVKVTTAADGTVTDVAVGGVYATPHKKKKG